MRTWASFEITTRMTASTESLRHTFSRLDPRLVPVVMAINEQRALRLVAALSLAFYAVLLPGGLFAPLTMSLLIIVGYAVLQSLLSLLEARWLPRTSLSVLITLLDLAFMAWQILNDPLPSMPTLCLSVLVIGLAALRWSNQGLVITFLVMLSVATLATSVRAYLGLAPFSWTAVGTMTIISVILTSLVLVMTQLARDYRNHSLSAPGIDTATGVFNRPTLYAAAELLMPLMHRQQQPLTLLYVVIEPTSLAPGKEPSLALQNDLCREFAEIAQKRLRGSDILVRYSPLEFVFLLLDCPSKQADPIAHHLQEAFHASRDQQQSPATAHIGATWLPSEPMALDQMLYQLDEAMVRARRSRIGVSGAIYSDPEQARMGHQLSDH